MLNTTYFDIAKNPWWEKGFKPTDIPEANFVPRFALADLKRMFYGSDLMLVIKGLRRLGKTTLIKQLIADVLHQKRYPGQNIYFVEFTEQYNDLKLVLSQIPNDSLTIIDEIQYCRRWKDQIKLFLDTYPRKRVVVTGSSRLDNGGKGEPLVGRFIPLTLTPLTFKEYLTLKYGPDFHPGVVSQKAWDDYIFYGEFPATLNLGDSVLKLQYLKDSVLLPLLSKDTLYYDVDKKTEFNKFFMVLASNMCQELSRKGMSTQIGIARQTLTKYLNVLMDLGVVTLLPNYYKSIRKSVASIKKPVYLSTNLALASLDITDFTNPALADFYGHVFENAIIANFINASALGDKFYYWRHERKELDLVKVRNQALSAWEIKSSQQINSGAINMYNRYAQDLGTQSFNLVRGDNFMDTLTKPNP